MFRLTFNRPAVRAFFSVDGAPAMRVRLDGATVEFLPIDGRLLRKFNDAAPGESRGRGGLTFGIDGSCEGELLATLEGASTPARPFFLLQRLEDGWIGLKHFDREGDPPRAEPHMRLWSPKAEAGPVVLRPASLSDHPALAYAAVVRHAAIIVGERHDPRRPGRPPREVEEARRVLAGFLDVVKEVRPALLKEGLVDMDALRRARDALDEVLREARPTKEGA